MQNFTIMVYDRKTKKYTRIDSYEAENSKEAIRSFREKTGWKPQTEDETLFAMYPICR